MQDSKGFTLIELLITISVVSVGIVGALVAIQQGIVAIDYTKDRLIGAMLAQEGVEILKNIRDTNLLENNYSGATQWDSGFSIAGIGGILELEVEYSDAFSADPSLDQLGCSPGCDFVSTQLRYLKLADTDNYNYSSGRDTIFKRKVRIEKIDSQRYDVDVVVYWRKRGGGNYEIALKQYLYEWWQ